MCRHKLESVYNKIIKHILSLSSCSGYTGKPVCLRILLLAGLLFLFLLLSLLKVATGLSYGAIVYLK